MWRKFSSSRKIPYYWARCKFAACLHISTKALYLPIEMKTHPSIYREGIFFKKVIQSTVRIEAG